MKSNDGYRMLQIGERGRRRGQYRIAELNGDGVLQSVGGWRNKDQAVADGYEELFELDLNNDGQAGVPAAIDVDADGFVDGLGHYRLMANSSSIDLKDQRGPCSVLEVVSSLECSRCNAQACRSGFGF